MRFYARKWKIIQIIVCSQTVRLLTIATRMQLASFLLLTNECCRYFGSTCQISDLLDHQVFWLDTDFVVTWRLEAETMHSFYDIISEQFDCFSHTFKITIFISLQCYWWQGVYIIKDKSTRILCKPSILKAWETEILQSCNRNRNQWNVGAHRKVVVFWTGTSRFFRLL